MTDNQDDKPRVKRGDPTVTGKVYEIRSASVDDKGKDNKKTKEK